MDLTKKDIVMRVVNTCMALAIVVCLIVNRAVSHRLTWFFIVGVSVCYGAAVLNTLVYSKKHRIYSTMLCISVGVLLLLSGIQAVQYFVFYDNWIWLFRYGWPIALLWIVLVWIPILLGSFTKIRWLDALGVFLLLGIAGEYVTRVLTGDIKHWRAISENIGVLENRLDLLAMAVLCFVLARVWKKRKE